MASSVPFPLSLTARDVAILQTAYSCNGVIIEQVRRRFFPHTSNNTYCRDFRRLVNAARAAGRFIIPIGELAITGHSIATGGACLHPDDT